MDELELILTDIFKCSRTELYLNSRSLAFKNKELKTIGILAFPGTIYHSGG